MTNTMNRTLQATMAMAVADTAVIVGAMAGVVGVVVGVEDEAGATTTEAEAVHSR